MVLRTTHAAGRPHFGRDNNSIIAPRQTNSAAAEDEDGDGSIA